MKQHLIVYAKRPLPGYAKTRLGADIGAEQAAGVYARLLYAYLLDLLHAAVPDEFNRTSFFICREFECNF